MYLTVRGVCLGIATGLFVGCGSSVSTTSYPDAQAFDSGIPDATAGGDLGPDVMKPAPMSGGGNVLLFGGPVQMLSQGPPCTHEASATGDRWCAFSSPSTTRIGSADLFVLNVSRAAAGVRITCGGLVVDLNCLKLTGGFAEDDTHQGQFQGDTLVYFDETATPYGWRPGMINGRMLASAATSNVHDCFGARQGNAVLCLRDLSDLSTADVTKSDLLAGRLDAANDPPLIRIDTVISFNAVDGNQQHFQDGFPTPAGDQLAWSTRVTPTGPEVLKIQTVGEATTLQTVGSDVTQWNASADGTRWFWLSQVNAMTGAGTLQVAPMPGGAAPTTLLTGVVDFVVAPTGGVAAVTATGGLQGIADPGGAPGTVVSIDSGVVGILRVSRLGHVAYAKAYDPILGLIDLYVRKIDGTGMRCTLTSKEDNPIFASFLPGAGAIMWARVTSLDIPIGDPIPTDGLLTSLSDCKTMSIGSSVRSLGLAGDDSVLFSNDGDFDDATLRVRNLSSGSVLKAETPTLIQTRVDSFISVFPSPGAVLFTVNASSPADGIYLHVIAPGASNADGGTVDGGSADGGTVD